jgi:hypothetical protein
MSVETYADCFIFTNAGTYDAAILAVSLTVVKFYCVVSFMLFRIYGYASAVFVQLNVTRIIDYGQYLMAEEGWEMMRVQREPLFNEVCQ